MLMNNEADYLITSPYAAEAELRRYKLHEEIVPSSDVLFDSNLFFVFATNSECIKLKEKFSKVLQEEDFSPSQIQELARYLVDQWGERFRFAPGLIEDQEEVSHSESSSSL